LIAGCCANGLARIESPIVRTTEQELTEYASAAAGEVNRLFVRARLTRKSDFFAPPAPSLDDRARSLIAAMQRTLDT
jgi:1,6-anhydro-N-acetylmuramate kinase